MCRSRDSSSTTTILLKPFDFTSCTTFLTLSTSLNEGMTITIRDLSIIVLCIQVFIIFQTLQPNPGLAFAYLQHDTLQEPACHLRSRACSHQDAEQPYS